MCGLHFKGVKDLKIKRLIARVMIGGPAPKIVKELDEHAQSLRQNPTATQIWNEASAAVARENRKWVVPALVLVTALQVVAGYYLRNLIDPWVSVAITIGVDAFLWRSFCVAERR